MPAEPILLVVQSLGHGGCERDAAKLAIGLDRARFTPHIAVFREGGFRTAEVTEAGIPILHLSVTSFLRPSVLAAARKLGAYVKANHVRVINAFDVPTDIFASFAGRSYRVPHIITAQLSYRTLVDAKLRQLLRVSDRLSDVVVVNSRAVGDSLRTDYGLPTEKVYLCYNGVNSQEFYPAEARRPSALRDASVVIGSVCVMRPEKRMDWLIRSFAEVRSVDSRARLLLVGSGPELPKLKELAASLGILEACFFEPGRPDVADWMRMMDIFVNASLSESFPNALLEAMACGCCAIGSQVGGIPELITHMQTGLVFDRDRREALTAALTQVATNSDLRRQIRENGFSTAHSRFSMHATVSRMESLYDSLLYRRGRQVRL